MKRRLYGASHPEIATILNNLAYTLELRGNYAAARSAYVEALDMHRRLLGKDHPEVAATLSNLAFVLDRQGKRAAAIELLRDVARDAPPHARARPPGRRGGRHQPRLLADRHRPVRRGAAPRAEESLAIRRKALGPEHPQVAGTLTVQGEPDARPRGATRRRARSRSRPGAS